MVYVFYCLLVIFFLDIFATILFCKREKNISIRIESKNNTICHQNTGGKSSKRFVYIRRGLQGLYRYYDGFIKYKIKLLGHLPSHHIRKFCLINLYQMQIEDDVVIYGGFEIRNPWNIKIGKGSVIGNGTILDGRGGIIIGRNVNFSSGVWIWTNQHSPIDQSFCTVSAPVEIEDRAWISSRTTILPGVTISEGSVVAAGAVVTKNCDPYKIYGGIPAKIIGERPRNICYEFNGSHTPFI